MQNVMTKEERDIFFAKYSFLKNKIKELAAEQAEDKKKLREDHRTLWEKYKRHNSDLMYATNQRANDLTFLHRRYNVLRGKEEGHAYADFGTRYVTHELREKLTGMGI